MSRCIGVVFFLASVLGFGAMPLGCENGDQQGDEDDDTGGDEEDGVSDDDDDDDDDNNDNDDDDDDIDPDTLFADLSVQSHSEVATVLSVKWEQRPSADTVRLEYTFEDDEWLASPDKPATPGEHTEALLGVPEDAEVTFRLVFGKGGKEAASDSNTEQNGSAPDRMPRPEVVDYDPLAASADQWMLGAVEDTRNMSYYSGPFWVYIIDRKGRVVWYYSDPAHDRIMGFPRISRDHTHIGIEKRGSAGRETDSVIHLLTLDYNYSEEIEVPNLCDCWDFTDSGSIVYNTIVRSGASETLDESLLVERKPDGTVLEIFDCKQWVESLGVGQATRDWCYSNTVNWDPGSDTILLSNPYNNYVLQIDRNTGDLKSQWGSLDGSWAFDPPAWGLEFPHFANITEDRTLLVSSHMPGENSLIPGEHRFMEFEIDEAQKTLREKWIYGEGVDDWPMFKGMAERLPGGNTLANYGTGGVIREITEQMETAWHVVWGGNSSNQYYNKMAGHNILIDDLYALCRGPKGRALQ